MKESEKQRIINELKDFYKKLKSYNRYLCSDEQLSQVQIRYRESLREKLEGKSGALKGKIIELTGTQYAEGPLTGKFDIWSEAFNTIAMSADRTALTLCISAVNEAIGKLESDIRLGIRDNQGNKKQPLPKVNNERSTYQKVWQWIDTHRILSILGALAAIATILGVIFVVFN